MRLGDIGEFGLIDRIESALQRAGSASGSSVVLGIGDDAAVLRLRAGEDVVVSTDALVEGVHFRWEHEPGSSIGRRAMAAALSDLAAMGARPLGVVIAMAAPPRLEMTRLDALVRGLAAAARRWQAPLVGGNIARSPGCSLTLTALGAVRRGRALRRDTARPGDRLFVTGTLGGAALSVARAARSGLRAGSGSAPEPRLEVGRALARLPGIGAVIDVSDGLLADLGHVLRASRVGAALDSARVPRPRGFAAGCETLGLDPLSLALTGGEDYELLFTTRAAVPSAAVLRRRLGVRVTQIGRIEARRGLRGAPSPCSAGWTHF